MRGLTPRRPQPWSLGPMARPTEPESCICGGMFTTWWSHRQTGRHKRHEGHFRKTQRLERLNLDASWGTLRVGSRKWRRAQGYVKAVNRERVGFP